MAGVKNPPCVHIYSGLFLRVWLVLGLSFLLVACQGMTDWSQVETQELLSNQTEEGGETPTPQGAFPEDSFDQEDGSQLLRQWGADAAASSEFADPEWSAMQATGAPDTDQCGDYQSAWASSGSDDIEWLVITYTVPVYATNLNIIQSFNPNQVSEVVLKGSDGEDMVIYSSPPVQVDRPCPYELSLTFDKTPFKVNAVRITLDQSVIGLGWNEIDAVELVGERD